jgi:hypothetical protein
MRPGLVVSGLAFLALVSLTTFSLVAALAVRDVTWGDLPARVQQALTSRKIDASRFAAWVKEIRAANEARLRDGNYDHLIHYALQSTRVTTLPAIEPAISAKAFVESKSNQIPENARARLIAFAAALSKAAPATGAAKGDARLDARMAHFRDIVGGLRGAALETRLMREYERAMRFLYEKEFVAGRARESAEAVASLYQTRGHSSDTEIEAGFAVYAALATLKQLTPGRSIARVLIVGPGLDLAPRTALLEEADPQSYQPFAVIDALRALRMTRDAGSAGSAGSLRVDAVDLNPHVATAIERSVRAPTLTLHVTSGIADTERTRFTDDYRAYLASFGRAIQATPDQPQTQPASSTMRGHVRKTIPIAPDVLAAIHASRLDIVTERLAASASAGDGATAYDLVIVTNVFPYLSDAELIVAIANIAAVLAPGGALIHNEPRPLLQSTAASLGLPASHARSVLIATVPGGNDLYDAIWIHQKR